MLSNLLATLARAVGGGHLGDWRTKLTSASFSHCPCCHLRPPIIFSNLLAFDKQFDFPNPSPLVIEDAYTFDACKTSLMDTFVGCGWTNMDYCADTCVWMDIFVSFPTSLWFGGCDVRWLARDFNLVLPLQLEVSDGIHEIHQAVGQGAGKKGIGRRLCGRRGIKQEACGSYGLASPYIGRGYGWTRARIHGSQIYFFQTLLS